MSDEDAEDKLDRALTELERIGWPCRLEELPGLYEKQSRQLVAMRDALAERSRELHDREWWNHDNCAGHTSRDWHTCQHETCSADRAACEPKEV
jgi:hypothetical protein